MWLPHRLYEAVPKICFLVGGLILAGALYVGFGSRFAPLYLFVALACMAYGASIMWLRYRYRRPRPSRGTDESPIVSAARQIH